MNKWVGIGRWTKDLELKFTPGTGTAVATGTIAIDRRFSKDNQKEADFIPIVIWGKQAESTATHSGKGKLVSIAGRIQTRSYNAKDGTKKFITEIVAEEVHFLEWEKKTQEEAQNEVFGSQGFEEIIDDGDTPW